MTTQEILIYTLIAAICAQALRLIFMVGRLGKMNSDIHINQNPDSKLK